MLALDRHNPQREMISQLLSDLYSGLFTQSDLIRALDGLLAALDDIVLDTPDADQVCSHPIADSPA